ncbi:putative homing endonuclease [Klebsiella phage BUCT86]|uniref:Homing endonuclease n=1 Tax=Klebsiella phage BUCT86 TaxID=2900302 RepID=A0AAE8YGG7_9CAUD|nr:putative homing endonuclease [Klebsiella phage BUCT86]
MSSCIDHGQVGTGLGYGSARYPALKVGGSVRMHRAEYCLANGLTLEDIAGLVVMHTCDNPRCINPEHLLLGTSSDNMQDRNKGARNLLGSRNPAARLTPEDVHSIREAYAGGETQVSIARRFGTSQGYISNIIKGRVWNEQKHPDNGL